MAGTDVERQIVALEHEFWNAMMAKDPSAATRLTAEECIIAGAQGVSTISNTSMGEMVQSGGWTLKSYEFDDITVRVPSPDMAVVAYHVKEELELEGKPLTLEANDASTWLKVDGNWVCILHTESIAGDPFGRDKVRS